MNISTWKLWIISFQATQSDRHRTIKTFCFVRLKLSTTYTNLLTDVMPLNTLLNRITLLHTLIYILHIAYYYIYLFIFNLTINQNLSNRC